ncbi:prephenate dehydrogenase/arogenate dehydrogenase family protein [Halocatena pleomorpha]|uniref:Prephenate dehydrogenase n=1 Tax=Halocatena pleomorpha TaxID=1785090 RepID=A0A3P3RL96_9EURY|nr:prephenate dehydrogenase/arogenate dehydrogenase family protein [Halocatena pleomorpha]RRJ33640.1 prephenate dehydrogenase [Halocatena pleomorpha]
MNVLVVGAGEMGTWFGGAVHASVAYADRNRAAAETAAAATDGRAVGLDTTEQFDVVCFAVPIPAVSDAIAAHADRATRAVVDITGIMEPAVAAMRTHASEHERVSLHPLFGAAYAPGRIAVVADESGPVTDRIRSTLLERGNELFETTAVEHDRSMSTVQAKTHAAILAFGLASEPVREEFHTPVSEQLSALTDRVTGGDPDVYAEIQAAFGGAEDVAAATRRIAEADAETFETLYRDAR